MNNFFSFEKRTIQSTRSFFKWFYHWILVRIDSFSIRLLYFLSLSFLGFCFLKILKPKTESSPPRSFDLFFTSVSASTVSSMSVVEMEVFSNSQLILMTILMFVGGEIFTSMVGLHFFIGSNNRVFENPKLQDKTELTIMQQQSQPDPENPKSQTDDKSQNLNHDLPDVEYLKHNSIKLLGFIILGYLFVFHFLGIVSVLLYLTVVSSAGNVLRKKGINSFTFSAFTVVSTFTNCGFVPTNENMVVFSKNSGLLIILIPQILLGNTLFPSCLRFSIWIMGKFFKKVESNYLLRNTSGIRYSYLLPGLESVLLVATALWFILIQFVLFCIMEWDAEGLSGLNSYQKLVGILFQTANSRHAGESIMDISTVAPAILVLFIVMMYLPPCTLFLPVINHQQAPEDSEKRRSDIVENVIFSQLSYLAILIIIICITERRQMKEDPLNFTVLNIVLEVISAYGNVGFSTGYSCDRRLNHDGNCQNKWYGFSGKWSDEGKFVLILVMIFGRLKKFNMNGGKAWKLS